jgi:hypothetical protein
LSEFKSGDLFTLVPSTIHVHLSMSTSQSQSQRQEHEGGQEENTDPFLELHPHTLYHHEHEPHHSHGHGHGHNTRGGRQVSQHDIDPSLHENPIAEGSGSGRTNRLTDFASHILGSQDGDHDHDHSTDHGHVHVHGHGHELSFTGEGGVLESSNHGFHVMEQDHHEEEMDEGEFEPHLEDDPEGDGEGEGEFIGEAQTPGPGPSVNGQVQTGGRTGRKRGSYGKRKKVGPGGDEIVIKKMNHVSLVALPLFSSYSRQSSPAILYSTISGTDP